VEGDRVSLPDFFGRGQAPAISLSHELCAMIPLCACRSEVGSLETGDSDVPPLIGLQLL
jgi:hypothetical protein